MLVRIRWLLYSAHFGTAILTALIVALPLYVNGIDHTFILCVLISYITSTMIGFWANDINDISRDKINKAYRPLASGLITKRQMICCCVAFGILYAFSLLYLFYRSANAFFVLIYFIIYIVYNYVNKINGFMKNITIACGFVLPYLFVVCQLGIVRKNIFILIATLFFFLYRELLMDINDKEGDKKTGLMTIPVRVESRTAHFIVAVEWLISIVFLLIHTFAYTLELIKISLCFVIIIILAIQNCIWSNCSLVGKKMQIFLISMWIPMSLSVFLIRT